MNFKTIKWQALFMSLFFISACTKIDYTKLGEGLIPVVDNINTFDTVLSVISNNYLSEDDSIRLNSGNAHMVGGITQDNVFGKTESTMFFELKPTSYPFTFAPKDSMDNGGVELDSAVLVLSYLGYYGDSTEPLDLRLYNVAEDMVPDTLIKPQYTIQPALTPNTSRLLGSVSVKAKNLRDSVTLLRGKDTLETVVNQLRIRLDQAYAREIFFADTANLGSNNAFKTKFKGYALVPGPGAKTLLYFSISSSTIQFYFRQNLRLPKEQHDTTSSAFTFTGLSGHAVSFTNDYAGSTLASNLVPNPDSGQANIYIQTSKGSEAVLKIPGLDDLRKKNRVIHRAELRITQTENLQDSQLTPPHALYIDVLDTTAEKTYKGLPYDLSPFSPYYCYPSSTGISFGYFGGLTNNETVNGNQLAVYRFNMTRYVQAVVSKGEHIYDFRLSAPFYTVYKDCANGGTTYPQSVFVLSNSGTILNPLGYGRISLAGGKNPDSNLKMQMRIIYSNL